MKVVLREEVGTTDLLDIFVCGFLPVFVETLVQSEDCVKGRSVDYNTDLL